MSWGTKYRVEFDPLEVGTALYTINFMQKGWSGNIKTHTAEGTPILQSWSSDDPKAPIKGSSISITLVSAGGLPITAFYSNEDDGFKVQLLKDTQVLFEGFLVQDDCSEELAGWNHRLELSANDNLGLLKEVPLDQAPTIYSTIFSSTEPFTSTVPRTLEVSNTFWANLAPGYRLTISGGTAADGVYTIYSMTAGTGSTSTVLLNENIVTTSATGVILVEANTSFALKMTLLSLIHICLRTTGLELNTHVYANLFETTHLTTSSFLGQTLIDPQAFLKDDGYEDCYSVLTKILERFNLTLFQSLGVWNIVRWDELRYYNNLIPGFAYTSNLILMGAVTLPAALMAGIGELTVAETGMLQRISRPFKFDKETFNYKQPKQLLKNYDLKELGTLRTQYTAGTGVNLTTTYEYNFPWWVWENVFPTSGSASVYFIRVIKDYAGIETARYVVVKTNDIHSYKIEANAGDVFIFNAGWRTSDSRPGPGNYTFYVKLTDGTTTKYLREPTNATPGWQNGVGWVEAIATGDNTNVWHTLEMDSHFAPIPFDGLITVYLRTFTTAETQYRDLRFTYIPSINDSLKVIGHTHTDTQDLLIKNKQDAEIHMDDSPRNSIVGTLFNNTTTGLLQTRTKLWKRGHVTETKKIGEITTTETLFSNRVPRGILEGTLIGYQDHASMLSVFKYNLFSNYYQWGRLEINYRTLELTGTLWENWRDGEVDGDLVEDYEFNYLYDTK